MSSSGDIHNLLQKEAEGKNTRNKLMFDPATGKLIVVNKGTNTGDDLVYTSIAAAGFFAKLLQSTKWFF